MAGNLVSQTGDVYWIRQQLANNSEDGLFIHRELSGNHYQPLGYDTGDRDLVDQVIICLEGLKMGQNQEMTNPKQFLPIASSP